MFLLVFFRIRVLLKNPQLLEFVFQCFFLIIYTTLNNYHAGYAAAANYPCLTIPMGYKNSGEPQNLTFISTSFNENLLYEVGYAFEKITKKRIPPKL